MEKRTKYKDSQDCTPQREKNNTAPPHRYVNKLDNATTKSKANIKLREKTELAPPKLILQNDPGEWVHFTKAPYLIQGLG